MRMHARLTSVTSDGDFAYVQVGCVTIKREGNRIVLVAGPGCQLAVSGNIDTVSVVVSSEEVGKP